MFRFIMNCIVPKSCILCQRPKVLICDACLEKLPQYHGEEIVCFIYEGKIRDSISQFKFKHQFYLIDFFCDALLGRIMQKPDIIIPVPLHKKRLRQRGFNQALEIVKPISRILNVPIEKFVVKKIKHTAPQVKLSQSARQKNLRNCFKVCKDVRGKHIALIDDVITTGTTTSTIKRLLLKHGATQVDIWGLAKTKYERSGR